MGVTARCLNRDHQVEYLSLGLFEFSGSHSAEQLQKAFTEVVKRFIQLDKVDALTTDNASNMRAFAKRLGLTHVPCFAHLLQLVVRAGLGKVPQVKALVKKMQTKDEAPATVYLSSRLPQGSKADKLM